MLQLRPLSLVVLFMNASSTEAQVAVLDCGTASDGVVVRYFEGKAPQRLTGKPIDFWSLVRPRSCPAEGPCYVTAEIQKELSCRKPQGLFVFQFKPVVFNANLQGQCGANVTGQIRVLLDGKQVLPATAFEDTEACYSGRDDPLKVKTITVGADRGQPTIAYVK